MSRSFDGKIVSDQEWADLHTIGLDIEWSPCGDCRECIRHGYLLGSFEGEKHGWCKKED